MGRLCLKLAVVIVLLGSSGAPRPQTPIGPALAIETDRFTVDGSPRFLLFISYFDALHASNATWTTDLEYLRRHVDGVRIFPNWFSEYCAGGEGGRNTRATDTLIRFDGSINDETLRRLIEFIKAAAQRSMIVDVTFTRDTVPVPAGQADPMPVQNYITAIRRVTESLAPYRNVLFDVQNEWQNKKFSDDEMRMLTSAVHAVDRRRLTAASTLSDIPPDTAGQQARDLGFDYVAYHDHRDPGWHSSEAISRQINGIRKGLQPSVKPVHFQEPMPWDRAPGCPKNAPGDPTPGHASEAAGFARRHGASAWTFHTRSTFNLRGTSFVARLSKDPAQKAALESLRAK